MPPGGVEQMEERDDKREGRDAERQVKNEGPSPREGIGDPTAGQRTRDQGDTEHASQISHIPAALRGLTMSPSIVTESVWREPMPRPWIARAATSHQNRSATPARIEPSMKMMSWRGCR